MAKPPAAPHEDVQCQCPAKGVWNVHALNSGFVSHFGVRISDFRFQILVLSALFVAGCAPNAPTAGSAAPNSDVPTPILTKLGLPMVPIPGGRFIMGDDSAEHDQKPAHPVRVSPFLMDVTEVTQASYQELTGRNPSKFQQPDRPVERVSWVAAAQYCNLRSLREGLTPCYDPQTLACNFDADGYRLPTEAEWEYACRAGTTTAWSFGDDKGRLDRYAWYKGNAKGMTQPVRRKEPNAWGLYDMHGNVAEWCNDYYAGDYGSPAEQSDPRGPASGDQRVLRGGSWKVSEESCRCAARAAEAPGFADACFGYEAYGFRCVRRKK